MNSIEELYKTSTDYDRLYDLIEAGNRVICAIDYRFRGEPDTNPASRDICVARKTKYELDIGCRGMSYLSFFNDFPDRKSLFKKACQERNLVWIVPAGM